jgi:competence protein ComGE
MKCSKGYVLAEMLAGLSILLMICSFLLPTTIYILQERKNMEFLQTANILLKEEVFFIVKNNLPATKVRTVNNKDYFITWKEAEGENGAHVCVRWQDVKKREAERCRYVKVS